MILASWQKSRQNGMITADKGPITKTIGRANDNLRERPILAGMPETPDSPKDPFKDDPRHTELEWLVSGTIVRRLEISPPVRQCALSVF